MSVKGKCVQSPSWKELCDATLHSLQNNVCAEPDRSAHLYFRPFCPLDPKLSVNIHSETHTAKESLWEHSIVKSNFKAVKNTVNNVELPRRREIYRAGIMAALTTDVLKEGQNNNNNKRVVYFLQALDREIKTGRECSFIFSYVHRLRNPAQIACLRSLYQQTPNKKWHLYTVLFTPSEWIHRHYLSIVYPSSVNQYYSSYYTVAVSSS